MHVPSASSLCRLLLVAAATAALCPAQPVVTANGENMRLASSSVTAQGSHWAVDLVVEDDNGNTSLPSSWRRWWHCQISGLSPAGETLDVAVRNAGYTDVILPVWSLSQDGVTYQPWTRVPISATPQVNGSTHRFTLQTPAGVVALRLAKYFPYTTADKAAFLVGLANHPSGRVRTIRSLGTSWQGRPIEMVELTDPAVPDAGKTRVWVHAGVHPAETTAYFTAEGLIQFLLSPAPEAAALLREAIVDVVPMPNPDGVYLGNYRSNALSVEIESQWAAPYNSPQREVIALRSQIEQFMGTVAAPAANPIAVVLNFHSSHNVAYPFHFQHVANASWNPTTNNSGVLPAVNALEGQWIAALRARSAFVRRGATQSSNCGAPVRPFVECMMHDRWSAQPGWSAPPGSQALVMAITLEGTYGRGPDGVTWNTPADYRQLGRDVGAALGDFLGVPPALATVASYGVPCGLNLSGTAAPGANGTTLALRASGGAPAQPAALLVGVGRTSVPLPAPFGCILLTQPLVQLPAATDATGSFALGVNVPLVSGLLADLQAVAADTRAVPLTVATSNGLEVQNPF